MKAKLICTAILALAPGFAAAESNPTESCIDALANEPRLQVLADRCVREVEVSRHLGRGQRVGSLQAVQDPPLGVGQLGHTARLAANTKAPA